ncbi:MAG: hypothetical protein LBC68_08255 [Prevotellaceae bacterium]|nr:hypothetical protein [Prevotellaceae bacterium]
MCKICNGIHPAKCPICGTTEKPNVHHVPCPDCNGNPHCCTCYGAGVIFNTDLDEVPDNTQVECPMCGKTVDAAEISFNQCAECNRNSDEAEEARFEELLKKVDTHIDNIRKIKIPEYPFLKQKTANAQTLTAVK